MTTNQEQPGPSMRDAGEQVASDLGVLGRVAGQRGQELADELRSLVDQHPLAATAAAFGAGYLLSGAVVSRLTLRLALLGARFYLGRVLEEGVGAAAGRVAPGGGARA